MFTFLPFVFQLRQTVLYFDRRLFRNIKSESWQQAISEHTNEGSGTCSTKQMLLADRQMPLCLFSVFCVTTGNDQTIFREIVRTMESFIYSTVRVPVQIPTFALYILLTRAVVSIDQVDQNYTFVSEEEFIRWAVLTVSSLSHLCNLTNNFFK